MAELWTLPAWQLTEGYAAGTFTPVDALASVLARCDAVNPGINAVIARDDSASLAAATESATRWRAGAPLSPLDGVPVSVKDNLLVAGLPATWGSVGLKDNVPAQDELPVARLRAGGAVLFAKTNVPELTVQGYTDNLLFGATGLPEAPALTPGGSSGGAVAAVSAGIGPLALCTDGGGSIRRPAAHAGLVGLKPGAARIARGGGFPPFLGRFEVVGPVGRDIRDVAAMFGWLAGAPLAEVARPRRILYARRFAGQPVDPEILSLCDAAADRLAAQGHELVRRESLDALAALDRVWPVVSSAGVAWMLDADPRIAAEAGPSLRQMAEAGRALRGTDYAAAMIALEELRLAHAETMQGFDLLMTPAIAAFSWCKHKSHPESIDGKPVGPRGHAVFTAFANALDLPAISLPVERSAAGLSCGMQLVGAPGVEADLLALGARFLAA